LADALWPELDQAGGGANLRKAIHHARGALDATLEGASASVVSDGEFVALASDGLSIDVEDFRASLAAARRFGGASDYEAALDVYRGELLPDDRYEEWAVAPRRELANEFVSGLTELVGLQESGGDLAAAMATARRLIEADPLQEEAHVALMRLYALTGRRSEAIRQFEQLVQILDEELGAEPGPGALRLYEEVRARQGVDPHLNADLWERVGDLRIAAGDATGAANAFAQSLAAGDLGSTVRVERKCAEAWLMQHRPDMAVDHLAAAERAPSGAAEQARLLRARANFAWESGGRGEREERARAEVPTLRVGEGEGLGRHRSARYPAHFTAPEPFEQPGLGPAGLRRDYDRGELPPVRDLRVRSLHCCRPRRESAIHRPGLRRCRESHGLRMCRRCLLTARSPGSCDAVRRRRLVLARPRAADDPRSPPTPGGTQGRSGHVSLGTRTSGTRGWAPMGAYADPGGVEGVKSSGAPDGISGSCWTLAWYSPTSRLK
jgi:DNA-binding SARP family transcriptional activator